MRNSQSAVEFIVLAAFMFFVVIFFFAATSSKVLEANEESTRRIARDISDLAYREIDMAQSVGNGYTRLFIMPYTIEGNPYNITVIDNRELVVSYLGYEDVRFLPANITGNISRGPNTISKSDGIIFLN